MRDYCLNLIKLPVALRNSPPAPPRYARSRVHVLFFRVSLSLSRFLFWHAGTAHRRSRPNWSAVLSWMLIPMLLRTRMAEALQYGEEG